MKKVIYLSIMFLMISLTISAQGVGGQITRKKANTTTTTQSHNSSKKTQNAQNRLAQQRRVAQLQAERERKEREDLEQAEQAHRDQFRQQEVARKKDAEEQRVKEELSNQRESFYTQEYVDLGLPSGTLWATKNIGAHTPVDEGLHFRWGEIEGVGQGKGTVSWDSYKYARAKSTYKNGLYVETVKLLKYNTDKTYGRIDNKKELDLKDDAAYCLVGNKWRIPSMEHMKELIQECQWTLVDNKDYKGFFVKGRNGNSIFLPMTGDNVASYWTSSIANNSTHAYLLLCNNEEGVSLTTVARFFCICIRPCISFK